MKRLTPVLVVDSIEPCLPFWCDRFGFTRTVEVPEGDALGFVILENGKAQLMLQSVPSVLHDAPVFAEGPRGSSLYVEVEDFDAIRTACEGLPIALPERTTFYGAQEIGVRDPAGNLVVFAFFPAE